MRKLSYFLMGLLPVMVSKATELDELDEISAMKWVVFGAASLMGGLVALRAKMDAK